MPVELVGDEPGAAAERKLLRSIVWKGLAAVVLEATAAGEAAGKADAVRAEILGILAEADEALVERMLTGSRTHATRRTHEMEAVGEMLRDLGVPSWMSDGVGALAAVAASVGGRTTQGRHLGAVMRIQMPSLPRSRAPPMGS